MYIYKDPSINYIRIGSTRLRYAIRQANSNNATPLLFLNGIGTSFEKVYPLVEKLPEYEWILFDLPGIGGSDPLAFPRRMKGLSQLTEQFLKKLGCSTVNIMGVSWGGGLAQEFVKNFPQKCSKLILAATSAGSVMLPGRLSSLSKFLSPKRFSRGYCQQIYAMLGWTSIHWLHKLEPPTLILAGEQDPLIPVANAKLMAKLIPRSTLRTFKGGHLFLLEDLEQSADIIRQFLV